MANIPLTSSEELQIFEKLNNWKHRIWQHPALVNALCYTFDCPFHVTTTITFWKMHLAEPTVWRYTLWIEKHQYPTVQNMLQRLDSVMHYRIFDLIDTAVTSLVPNDLDPLTETLSR